MSLLTESILLIFINCDKDRRSDFKKQISRLSGYFSNYQFNHWKSPIPHLGSSNSQQAIFFCHHNERASDYLKKIKAWRNLNPNLPFFSELPEWDLEIAQELVRIGSIGIFLKDQPPKDVILNIFTISRQCARMKDEINRLTHRYSQIRFQSLQRLSRSLTREFNNILTVILGNAQLARMTTDPKLGEQYLLDIEVACQEAADLLSQLFCLKDASAITGKSRSLEENIMASAPMIQRLLGDKTEFEFNAPPFHSYLDLSEELIQQLLFSLACQAIMVTPGNGRFSILADHQYDPIDECNKVILTCLMESDSNIAHLFKNEKDSLFPDILPEKFLDRIGAKIHYSLITNQKISMQILLPISDDEEITEETPAMKKEHVLLLEPDKNLREICEWHLLEQGCEVSSFAKASEAMTYLRKIKPGIRLMIIEISALSEGPLEWLEESQKINPGTSFLFTTGIAKVLQSEVSLKSYNHYIMQKPFKPTELVQNLQNLSKSSNVEQST